MKKIELKSRRLLRTIFGCLSFTAVAFAFQACYGTPRDHYDVRFVGTVKAKDTNLPIQGIKVMLNDESKFDDFYGLTDEDGQFDFYAGIPIRDGYYGKDGIYYAPDSVRVHFLDVDSLENGYFFDKTVIVDTRHKDGVIINVELDEQ